MDKIWLDEISQVVKRIDERVRLTKSLQSVSSDVKMTPAEGVVALSAIREVLWLHRANTRGYDGVKMIDGLIELIDNMVARFKTIEA